MRCPALNKPKGWNQSSKFHECSAAANSCMLSSCSSHDHRVLGGFSCLFIILAATARHRESKRFNRDSGTSRKPIIHALRSLHFCAEALNGFWYSMMNYHNQMRMRREGGRARKRDSRRLKEKIQEEFFASTPSGCSVCWWSTVRFSGKRLPSLPPTRLETESSPSGGVPSSSQSARALL